MGIDLAATRENVDVGCLWSWIKIYTQGDTQGDQKESKRCEYIFPFGVYLR